MRTESGGDLALRIVAGKYKMLYEAGTEQTLGGWWARLSWRPPGGVFLTHDAKSISLSTNVDVYLHI